MMMYVVRRGAQHDMHDEPPGLPRVIVARRQWAGSVRREDPLWHVKRLEMTLKSRNRVWAVPPSRVREPKEQRGDDAT